MFQTKLLKAFFRERTRNFVTARTGMFAVFVMLLSTFVFHVVYNFEYWTGILDLDYTLDSSTKAVILSVYGLAFDCIINPCVLLSNAPTVQRAVHKWKIKGNMKELLMKCITCITCSKTKMPTQP